MRKLFSGFQGASIRLNAHACYVIRMLIGCCLEFQANYVHSDFEAVYWIDLEY